MKFEEPMRIKESSYRFKYILKDNIELSSFNLKNDNSLGEVYVYEQTGKYLSVDEMIEFERLFRKDKELLNVISSDRKDVEYVPIEAYNLNVPAGCYNIIEIPEKKTDEYYSFENVGDYFVTIVSDIDEINNLVNSAILNGYTIKNINTSDMIVEMIKIKNLKDGF